MSDGSTGSIKVMIVDDHEMVAESVRRLLDGFGDITVVAVVGTVKQAIEVAGDLDPDVVLMDYRLPDGDGVSAAAEIRSRQPDAKVVLFTGAGEDEQLALRAIEAGCSGFLTKNRGVDELLAAVRAAHAGEVLVTPSMLSRLLPRLQRSYRGLGSDLSKREREVLQLIAEGASNRLIAERLVISLNTARKHVQNVIGKLHVHSKLEAIVVAAAEGIIDTS